MHLRRGEIGRLDDAMRIRPRVALSFFRYHQIKKWLVDPGGLEGGW